MSPHMIPSPTRLCSPSSVTELPTTLESRLRVFAKCLDCDIIYTLEREFHHIEFKSVVLDTDDRSDWWTDEDEEAARLSEWTALVVIILKSIGLDENQHLSEYGVDQLFEFLLPCVHVVGHTKEDWRDVELASRPLRSLWDPNSPAAKSGLHISRRVISDVRHLDDGSIVREPIGFEVRISSALWQPPESYVM